MRQRQNRLAMVVGLLPLSAIFAVGCDNPQGAADKEIIAILAQADNAGSDDARVSSIERAAQINAASFSAKVNVQDILGNQALASARIAHAKADDYAATIHRLLLSLSRMTGDINSAAMLVEELKKYEPVAAKTSVDEKLKELNEGQAGVWIAPLSALTAVKSNVAELQQQISSTEAKIAELNTQRDAALTEATSLESQSAGAKGQQSVDLYKQASGKRKEAMDLATQIDVTSSSLIALRQDLAVAQGQEEQRTAAVASFQQTDTTLDEGWQAVQAAATAVGNDTKALVEGEATGTGSVSVTATELATAIDEYEKAITDATAFYDNAVNHYGQASTEAQKYVQELSTLSNERAGSTDIDAFKSLQATFAPSAFNLKRGSAQHGLAILEARQAVLLKMREQVLTKLTASLSTAGVTAPAGVAATGLTEASQAAAAKAGESFAAAVETLSTIAQAGGSTPGARATKGSGAVALMLTEYAWSQFATSIGDTAAATQHLTAAKDARSLASEDPNTQFPALPTALALPATATPGAPAAAPTAAPAEAPAEAPAPAPTVME